MNFLPDIIRFNIPFIAVVLIAAISFAVTYWLYKKTARHIQAGNRSLLTFLRGLALFLIILLLLDPQVLFSFLLERAPRVALIVDASGSMGLQSERENRADSTSKAFTAVRDRLSGKTAEISAYTFNTEVTALTTDTLPAFEGGTDFSILRSFLENNAFDQALLISDGIRSSGPLVEMPATTEIISIGVGARSGGNDLFVADVLYPAKAYRGQEENLRVRVGGRGGQTQKARLVLLQGDRILASRSFDAPAGGSETEIELPYTPSQTGTIRYTVAITEAGSDANVSNNRYTFVQSVLKSKIRAGMFTAAPNYEHKFSQLLLSDSPNIETWSYVNSVRQQGNVPFDSLDVVILVDWPSQGTNSSTITSLAASIQRQGQGVIIFAGARMDVSALERLLRGASGSSFTRANVALDLDANEPDVDDPLLLLFEEAAQQNAFWRAIPPVKQYWNVSNEEIWLTASATGMPERSVLSRLSKEPRKVWLFNGQGFWRWHFSLAGSGEISDGYKRLLQNLVKRLGQKQPFQPVMLQTDAATVTLGRPVAVSAYLFDGSNNPAQNGTVMVEVSAGERTFSLPLNADSAGVFKGSFVPAAEGRYSLQATGVINGRQVGRDQKTVDVLPYQKEFVRTERDSLMLKQMARESGGAYVPLEKIDRLDGYINSEPQRIRQDRDYVWRTKPLLLLLIIVVIAAEWWLRKRNDLI